MRRGASLRAQPKESRTLRGGPPDEAFLESLPSRPGIYLMRDSSGAILYVGKAKNLRSRVRSYFGKLTERGPWIERMRGQIATVDYILTGNEVEALILESNYVKRYQPKYNSVLKDDKHFPYLKLSTQEEFPRLSIVRRVERDGATYLGPYPSAGSIRKTIRFLHKVFPLCQCAGSLKGKDARRCIYFQMGQCLGPCSGLQPKEDYRRVIKDVLLFMQGRDRELLARLRQEMGEAADALDFERAAKLRDQIAAIERVVERQRIVSPGGEDQDVIGLDRRGDRAAIKVFFVRGGKLLGDEGFTVSCEREEADGVVLSAFLKQFYSSNSFIPCEILLGEEVPEGELIEEWLSQRRGRRVRLLKPVRGFKRRLAEMARENAAQAAERPGEEQAEGELLFQLKRALALEAIPLRIEAFDISSIQGQRAAGASVLFVKGEPAKEGYRRYIIKGVQEPDDYAMLEEVLTRRLTRLINEGAELPHLILIDGGRGQLGVALSVLERLGVADVEAAAIAKGREAEARQEHDVIYRPGKRGPIVLPPDSPAKHLLQRIRDEVHRFAITFHRSMRRREGLRSSLTEVPGLGPKRRRELLRRFGSLSAVLEADVQELASVPGMTEKVALALKRYFGEGEG